jgi:anti-anti-sigma factor
LRPCAPTSRTAVFCELHVEVEEASEPRAVRFVGEFDSTEGPASAIDGAQADRPSVVGPELSRVRFIDSTSLGLIVRADDQARREGGRAVLVRGSERVHRVFLIALLDRQLKFVYDPREIAAGNGMS